MIMNSGNRCPRCEARLRSWDELGDEEREMIKRLPGSAAYSLDERKARHRWCTRCWFEETSGSPTIV
jgi:hypothetical protein